MRIEEMIAAIQAQLGLDVDGKAGPQTWGAIYARIVQKKIDGQPPALAIATVDARSEKAIATLLPQVQPMARALVQKAAASGIQIKVISGTRSFEEQDALFAKGRTAPGPKVTNARGGFSNHNFGIAFDIGVFSGNRYLPESPKYKAVGVLGMELGLEWAATGPPSSTSPTSSCARPGRRTSRNARCWRACASGSPAGNRCSPERHRPPVQAGMGTMKAGPDCWPVCPGTGWPRLL